MDQQTQNGLAWLERRSRQLTGAILAVLALIVTYGLLIYEGHQTRPAFHFYPWLAAVLFYFAGDLLAYVWFRVVSMRLQALWRAAEQRAKDTADTSGPTMAGAGPRPAQVTPPDRPSGNES